ncbi:hypothetical protein VA7868_02543 [Vibrio aerogenes CECT 7868]|uniref:Uncharacterized protein n=1 Tax=Vibrio aerogenes CECT 7868 TaxID=1216006 RepID=A0A1M5ZC44_9VIBR|nr:hypothetical protein VA7868_02543 [Vibrio aerogenes CECT 7868]
MTLMSEFCGAHSNELNVKKLAQSFGIEKKIRKW